MAYVHIVQGYNIPYVAILTAKGSQKHSSENFKLTISDKHMHSLTSITK